MARPLKIKWVFEHKATVLIVGAVVVQSSKCALVGQTIVRGVLYAEGMAGRMDDPSIVAEAKKWIQESLARQVAEDAAPRQRSEPSARPRPVLSSAKRNIRRSRR